MLNGEKMWITNGGFADVFIVFAKVDGEHFSAFIVERGFPGVSTGKEEHKMGLHGSSTVPVILQDARVPAENLLGDVGKGHKIAFNVLNYGRFKLAAMCSGGAKAAIGEAAAYAVSRRQFGQSIASFGAIRHKLAAMTIWTFAVESMLYRTAGLIDTAIGDDGHEPKTVAAALEEYAIECSLLKVAGSEMLDFVIDEEVQIFGGNGFVRDYPAERRYRDARVNRIFEGTSEINRLLVPTMLLRRAMKSGLPLMQAAKAVQDELVSVTPPAGSPGDEPLGNERRTVTAMRKTALAALGLAATTYGDALQHEQEVLMLVSDIVMEMFAAESATLRAGPRRCGRPSGREPSGGRRGRLHARRRAARGDARADALRGHVDRRRAAHRARRTSPHPEDCAVEHHPAAPPNRRSRGPAERVRVRMTRRRLAFVLAAVLAAGCTSGPPPPPTEDRPYEQQVQAARADKDAAFRTQDNSPIPIASRAAFPGLSYFAVDPTYRVPALLTEDPSQRAVVMELPTSSTELRRMRKVGALGFTVAGALVHAHGVRRRHGARRPPAVRSVRRSDQRHRDLQGRPVSRPRSHTHRPVRPGLQPRLSSVLCLRRVVRLPRAAAREPHDGRHQSGRTARGVPTS